MACPPAFSILALAEPENLLAVILRARLSSPSPSTLTSTPAANQATGGEHGGRHLGDGGVEPGEIADVDDFVREAEAGLVEAALRELAVKRHLAALKAGTDGAAAAGRLALAAAAGGLAMAAAFAAADTLAAVDRTGDVLKFVEFHGRLEW